MYGMMAAHSKESGQSNREAGDKSASAGAMWGQHEIKVPVQGIKAHIFHATKNIFNQIRL
jgi:hypothetical protein